MQDHTLVLLRHGESTWNNENKFTGWVDVPLSIAGKKEAKDAGRYSFLKRNLHFLIYFLCGRLMHANGYVFDIAYTSFLKVQYHCFQIVNCNFILEGNQNSMDILRRVGSYEYSCRSFLETQ